MSTPARPTELELLCAAEARRMSTLRTQMLEAHPFWGYLLMQVKLVTALELPCFAATDCVRHIWFNPRWTQHLSVPQLGFVLAHEVCHQVFASEDRRQGRDPHYWNCATDFAINRIVARIPRPGGRREPLYASPSGTYPELGKVAILDDPRYDGMIAEAIYETLRKRRLFWQREITVALPTRQVAALDHVGGIDVHLPGASTPRTREKLHERLQGAAETWRDSGERGFSPDDPSLHGAAALTRAQVPWQRLFRRHVDQALARDEYALTRPNRRYLAHDIVVPGLHSERLGHVVVALDTSGSMDADTLSAVASEISQLAAQAADATLIVADSQVHEVIPLARLDAYLAAGHFAGGGGTDHRPVFDYLRQQRVVPDVFVGLTDLASQFPERRPAFPVLWVVPPDHCNAPWGSVIEVR